MKYKYERRQLFGKRLNVPKDVLERVYNKYLTFSDYVMYDLFDKIPLECMLQNDRLIVDKIGLEKAKGLDWGLINLLRNSFYSSRDNFNFMSEFLNLVDRGIDPIEAVYEIGYRELKPKYYTEKMRELHPEKVFSEQELDSLDSNSYYIAERFNDGSLTIDEMVKYWSIFKDKDLSFCLGRDIKNEHNITTEQIRDIMEQYNIIINLAMEEQLIDPYDFINIVLTGTEESKNEYLARISSDIVGRVLSSSNEKVLSNDDFKELFKYVDPLEVIKDKKSSDEFYFQDLLEKNTIEEVLDSGLPFQLLFENNILSVMYLYGLKNIMQFDRECDHFFSKDDFRMLRLVYPMYLHYANNNHNNDTSFLPVKFDQDGNYVSGYTLEDFYEIVKRMIMYGPNDWNYSDQAPDFRSIGGKFREVYPGFFLSDDAPEELQNLFYTKKLTPVILHEHPEYIPYLEGKDLIVGFKGIQVPVIDANSDFEEYDFYRCTWYELYPFLLKNNSSIDALNFIKDYAYFFKYIHDNRDIAFAEESTVEDMKDILVQMVRHSVIHEKGRFPEFIPDELIERYPDTFLPINTPDDLKKLFYNRELTAEYIKNNRDQIETYFNKIDLGLFFPRIKVLREKDKLSYPEMTNLAVYLEEKLGRKDAFELLFTYGEYLEKMTDITSVFRSNITKEDIINIIEKEIYDNIVSGKFAYSPSIGEHFMTKYPTLFLDKDVPPAIQDKFYGRNVTIDDFNDPEFMKYFKNTDISFGLPLDYSWMHKLFENESIETANLNRMKIYIYCQKIDDVELRRLFIEYLVKSDNVNMDNIEHSVEVLRRLSLSNSSEIRSFKLSLANQILDTENPLSTLEQIEETFLKNHVPVVGKIYSCFRILHPKTEGFDYVKSAISPTLKRSSSTARELIIFSDLIKASFGSNNRSVNNYLDNLSKSNEIYKRIRAGQVKYEDLSKEEQDRLLLFSRNISTLYNNSLLSQRKGGSFVHTDSVIDDLNKLYELVAPNGKLDFDLGDRVVSMFCHFAGIDTIEQAKEYISKRIKDGEQRNIETAKDKVVFQKGDLVKGIGSIEYLGSLLQNGIVAKEFLGSHATSDGTPLDTDVAMIEVDGTIGEQIQNSAARSYGNIWFVLRNDDRFNITRDGNGVEDGAKRNLSKLELFYTGVVGKSHYGIRTGFASSEIDCIVAESYDPRIGLEIAINGFYIPVANKEGEIVFSYDDYLDMRKAMAGMSHFGESEYVFSDSLITPDVEELASLIEESNIETQRKRELINRAIAKSLEEMGLKLKTTIDGDLTEGFVELFDTGSTGRGTNKPGDGDFDFMMRVDKAIYSDPKKMEELRRVLLKNLGRENDSSGIIGTGDFRLKGVDVSPDVTVDIDITFIEKTDEVTYSTDMALEDRLSSIKKQDPEKYSYVVANILLAKRVLKEAEAYKPNRGDTPQGGLGGVGIENWILQNGGSFYEAATSFLEAAEGKSFEEFRRSYAVWDFGENHLASKRGKYPHDNFVNNNMSSGGYDKMVAALKAYVKTVEVSEVKQTTK